MQHNTHSYTNFCIPLAVFPHLCLHVFPWYLVKMKDKPECPVILWIWSYLLCTPKYEETFVVQELSIYGMIFHMKSKVLETWTFSKTSSIIGWIPKRPMKSEKRCFKLSHPWYININTPNKPIKKLNQIKF